MKNWNWIYFWVLVLMTALILIFGLLLLRVARADYRIPDDIITPIPPEYQGSALYYRWNEEKQCYDEDSFRGTFIATEPKEGIDPDWVSAMIKNDGCVFYFHPTQGQENAPIIDNKEPVILPQTGGE